MATSTLPTATSQFRSLLVRWLPLVWYLALALIATQPLVLHLTSALPLAGKPPATVPLFNLWTLWWNADRAAAGFAGYWDAPIFAPTASTFAFSEPQPTLVAVAPLVWLTGSRILAYNVYLLLALVLNGWAAHGLIRSRGGDWLTCCLAGTLVELLPWVSWQLDCLQLVPIWGVIWTAGALFRLLERPCWNAAWQLGVAHGLTYWLCNYYGLFQTLLLSVAGLCLVGPSLLRWRTWGLLLASAGISASLVLPLALKQRAVMRQAETFVRDRQLIVNLSASLRDYTDPPGRSLLPQLAIPDPQRHAVDWRLGPGNLRLLIVPFGFLAVLLTAGRRRWTLFWAVYGLTALALSLGPDNRFWGGSPYDWLREHVPGFGQIRSPFRFAMFVQLAVLVLVVEALQALRPRTVRNGLAKFGRWLPYAGLAAVALLDVLPIRQTLWHVPKGGVPEWVRWLRDEAEPDGVVLQLPQPAGTTVDDYEISTLSMYWQMDHRRPLVAGYSGFFPERVTHIRDQLWEFPAPHTLPAANACGARYVVLPRDLAEPGWLLQQPPLHLRWMHQTADEAAGMDVYEIVWP